MLQPLGLPVGKAIDQLQAIIVGLIAGKRQQALDPAHRRTAGTAEPVQQQPGQDCGPAQQQRQVHPVKQSQLNRHRLTDDGPHRRLDQPVPHGCSAEPADQTQSGQNRRPQPHPPGRFMRRSGSREVRAEKGPDDQDSCDRHHQDIRRQGRPHRNHG